MFDHLRRRLEQFPLSIILLYFLLVHLLLLALSLQLVLKMNKKLII